MTPSTLLALLPPGDEGVAISPVLERLQALGRCESTAPTLHEARWELSLDIDRPEAEPHALRIGCVPVEPDALHLSWGNLTEPEQAVARTCRWAIVVQAALDEHPLADFQRLLQVCAAAVPDTPGVLDLEAATARSGAQIRDLALAEVPPDPIVLFSIHAVQSETGPVWMHTHGLIRCGQPELEVLDVDPEHVNPMGQLVNAVGRLWISGMDVEPDEEFLVGEDLPLVWLPWEEALKKRRGVQSGGLEDRDEVHGQPSAVLFVPRRRWLLGRAYDSPTTMVAKLEADPLLYVSSLETERMALMAHARLDRFRELHDAHHHKEDWLFLVKLGYVVDGGGPDDREHLWFQVHGHGHEEVDATLLNAPYHIERMSQEQRDQHSLERMSSWTIICPAGRFNPETLVFLEEWLSETEVDSKPGGA